MKHLRHDVFRLAGTYLAIIMVMSFGFSVIFYMTSARELDRKPRGYDTVQLAPINASGGMATTFEDYLLQRADESRRALLLDLILVNLAALILGSILSYFLAERTLQPIEDNMEAQSQFVSDASHELRTPLTALLTANEVALRNKNLKLTDARQVIADNVADITRLQELANSMLGLLKDDDAAMLREEVPLQMVVSDAMNLVVNQALDKEIAVEDNVANLVVRGNRQRLTQLVTILLDNAVKYSRKSTTVYLASERQGNRAVLIVRDEGVGMDAGTLEHIFTRFYRAEKSRTTGGYGLGLSIAKKIVDAHHGKITVSSVVGKGTEFRIYLPIVG